MKKSILSLGLLLAGFAFIQAQTIDDVLRYSLEDIKGTARYHSMAGAFGALGGDLSGLNVNPAGSSVFSEDQFVITGNYFNIQNDVSYGGTLTSNPFNSIDLNQAGAVFVYRNNGPWRKVALAINYDQVQDFDNEYRAIGSSDQGIDNYFQNFANGVPFGDILLRDGELLEEGYLNVGRDLGFGAQQAFLGYFGGIIDPTDASDENGTTYVSNASYSSVNQDYLQATNGYNSRITVNASGQYENVLNVGASLNFHSIFYERTTFFSESGYDTGSGISFVDFDNFLRTQGTGFSFSVGAIARLGDVLRIGGSFQSPTWYRLTDDTAQRVNSDLADSDIRFINFNVLNFFDEHRIKTPSKVTGSAALVFGKQGLLSFDYGHQDFSTAELRPNSDPAFAAENQLITDQLGVAQSFRIGGEWRFNNISLRGGYRLEESPYESSDFIGDLESYSGGLGFSFDDSRIDLAVSHSQRMVNEFFFDSGSTNSSLNDQSVTNVVLSYTLKF